MRVIIQRVRQAKVEIDHCIKSSIGKGLLILAGFEEADTPEDLDWVAHKIVQLRIFNDPQGMMNVNVKDAKGEVMVVSQFTLHASTRKGNRPSFIKAAKPERAIPLYQDFINLLETALGKTVATGEFGADMQITLVNDGPVTIMIDSKQKE